MSSAQALRGFINDRLTAAATEIFTVFEQTIVQYEEKIDHQRRLLERSWSPQNMSDATVFPQHHDCRGEQFFDLEKIYCSQQKDPEPPQVKEEPEEPELQVYQEEQEPLQIKEHQELGTSQEGERLTPNFDSYSFYVPSTEEQSYLSEGEEVPDAEQFPSHDSESTLNAELKETSIVHSDRVDNVPVSENQAECEKLLCEETCENVCKKPKLHQNYETFTDEKKITCELCGKSYSQQASLLVHMRTHTGEKPYCCETCGNCFSQWTSLMNHMRTHKGEKPYSCGTCGKSFSAHSHLLRHTRIHTGEKPYSCEICGKCFGGQYHLLRHMRTHTGEKPYSCEICDNSFNQRSTLVRHMRTHKKTTS